MSIMRPAAARASGLAWDTPGPTVATRYWHALDDGRIQCDVCPRACKLHDGQQGLCFVRARAGDRNNVFLAIVAREGDRHIGNIKLGPIDWLHRTGDIGILIGERDCWGKGYAAEAIALLAEYAFGTLNLHKLTASCYEPNQGSTRAFTKAGFEIEGVRKQQFFCEGRYVDLVLLGRVRDE